MLGARQIPFYREEGREAAINGKQTFDNPYCFIWETQAAYAWEDGYKEAKQKEKQ